MYEAGLNDDLHQSTETGCYGGVPTSGVFFGSAVNAEKHESSSWVFHQYEQNLDLACLGILEVDSDGNVNVSRRGPTPIDYVGPGGFTDITHCAKMIVFVGSFAAHARMHLVGGRLVIDTPGEPKFVEKVAEVTFNGRRAIEAGKKVWYVTHLGAFRLTPDGLVLDRVMPGVDVERDIVAFAPAKILVPDEVPVVPSDIVTGEGFRLSWPSAPADETPGTTVPVA